MQYEQRVWLEKELMRTAGLLTALVQVRDRWDPGSPIKKLIDQLHDKVEGLSAELLETS